MGWTSIRATKGMNNKVDRKGILDEEFTENNVETKWEVVKSCMVGSTYYGAIKRTDLLTGQSETSAVVVLTEVNNAEYWNFSFKEMHESTIPSKCDCPKVVLQALDETKDEMSNVWRKRCQDTHKKKNEMDRLARQFKIGDKLKTKLWYEEERTLEFSNYNNRNVWIDWTNLLKYSKKQVFSYPFKRLEQE